MKILGKKFRSPQHFHSIGWLAGLPHLIDVQNEKFEGLPDSSSKDCSPRTPELKGNAGNILEMGLLKKNIDE